MFKVRTQVNYDDADLVDKLLKDIVTDEYPKNPLEVIGETSLYDPENVPNDQIGTSIQEFYRGAVVFITGSTGFMGKVLTEKLLRSVPHIKHLYLMVRPKKGKSHDERFRDIFKDRLFRKLKHKVPKYFEKVSPICGHLDLEGFGISKDDRTKLINEVNIIFHGGATVNFKEPIDVTIKSNVHGTLQMIHFAKQMKHLKALLYISTAYSYCPLKVIEEKVYPAPLHYTDVISKLSEGMKNNVDKEKLTSKIIMNWPNAYTFSKALAESIIATKGKDLPTAIIRPSVMISTYRDPVKGWTDNLYGPTGVMIGFGYGLVHTLSTAGRKQANLVPVDIAVNLSICAAFHAYQNRLNPSQTLPELPVFNCSTDVHSPITYFEFYKSCGEYLWQYPSIDAVWYLSGVQTDNYIIFRILHLLLHIIPGHIIDTYLKFKGDKPMLINIYNKLISTLKYTEYFHRQDWVIKVDETNKLWDGLSEGDKELFFFDLKNFCWEKAFEPLLIGLRIYLCGEDIDTLPAARRKWKRFSVLQPSSESILQLQIKNKIQ